MSEADVKPEPSPARLSGSEAFEQAMWSVDVRCGRLNVAIHNHHVEDVEYTARVATNAWLNGRSACRRLLEHVDDASPFANAARNLLEANYMLILELFALATKTIAVPRMIDALSGHRAILVAAMARPLLDGDSSDSHEPVLRS